MASVVTSPAPKSSASARRTSSRYDRLERRSGSTRVTRLIIACGLRRRAASRRGTSARVPARRRTRVADVGRRSEVAARPASCCSKCFGNTHADRRLDRFLLQRLPRRTSPSASRVDAEDGTARRPRRRSTRRLLRGSARSHGAPTPAATTTRLPRSRTAGTARTAAAASTAPPAWRCSPTRHPAGVKSP